MNKCGNSRFSELKASITMKQVVEFYGYPVSREGFIVCPFHADTHPSCKVYPGSGGYYCFVCNEGGTVVDFTMRLFGLSALDAAKKLSKDFGLPMFDGDYDRAHVAELSRKRAEQERARKSALDEYRKKNSEYRELWITLKDNPPCDHESAKMYAELKSRMDWLEQWLYEHKEAAAY